MASVEYLHGFDKREQQRLLDQAKFLEPYIYRGIDLEFNKHLLEVGCGVGAQTEIIARRFPDLKITGVDLSETQLKVANEILKPLIKEKRVTLKQQNALKLALPKKDHDAAFLCWFLEHVPKPLEVLKKIRRHLKSGAKIYCTEVFNQTLFMEPYSPAYLKYWFEFNDLQTEINGHPFIGAQLGNLLLDAGFTDVQTEIRPFHFDAREPEKRKAFTEYFYQILVSAEPALMKAGRIDKKIAAAVKREVEIAKKSRDAVFFYAFMRATATVP